MATDNDEIETLIDDCFKRFSKLNDWEKGFMDGISERNKSGKRLTPNQIDTLNNIWERIT